MPKLAYPIENFLSSYTSQFEINLLAETLENPSGSSSAQNCSCNPNIYQIWTVSAPSLSHIGPASVFLGLRQPQEALHQLSGPLSQTRWPLWCSTQHLVAFVWPCVNPCWLCVTLLGCCTALPAQSLPSLFSVLNAPQLLSRSLILSLLTNPALENRITDHLVYFSKWPSSLFL